MTDERPMRASTTDRTPAAAVKAVAGFVEMADSIDQLISLIRSNVGEVTVSESTQRLVFALQGNQIAQVGFAITKLCEHMLPYTDGSPTDIHGGRTLLSHRVDAVSDLTELLEVLGRFCGLKVETSLEIANPEDSRHPLNP